MIARDRTSSHPITRKTKTARAGGPVIARDLKSNCKTFDTEVAEEAEELKDSVIR